MHFLEYIWLDKDGFPRSKVRTYSLYEGSEVISLRDCPVWNFDASSTGQNIGPNTEAVLKPVRVYPSPIDKETTLVLCQLDLLYDQPHKMVDGVIARGFNTRYWAEGVEQKFADLEPWFGVEQEYTWLDPKTNLPYHWEEFGRGEQGDYYCSVRYPYCQLNQVVREHLILCAQAGIKINGFNAEVLPSQWEFQIGPEGLLKVADDLIVARYLLCRLSAKYGVKVSFHPKPMQGDWNGSGCHINFSTKAMREEPSKMIGSFNSAIGSAIENLAKNHPKILEYYGDDNHMRLTGLHETSSMEKFTYGIGTRHTSVRIPTQVVAGNGSGYIEDRRPASNIDPYLALSSLLISTQCDDLSNFPQ